MTDSIATNQVRQRAITQRVPDQSHQKSQRWAPVIRSAYAASVYGLLPCQMLSGQNSQCSAATSRGLMLAHQWRGDAEMHVEKPTATTRAPNRLSQSRTTAENFAVSFS